MPFQVSPGVLTTEKNYTTIIPGISTSIGGIVGSFGWGPVDTVVTISDENKLVEIFGKPDDDTYLTFFNAANFLSYSTHLETVRVIGENARNAISGGKGTGLTLTLTTINGEISSAVIVAAGANYRIGDLVYPVNGLTKAVYKVKNINETGGVTDLDEIDAGSGYTNVVGVATTTTEPVVVRNTDDFENSNILPEIIGRFPGSLGNSLMVSIVRASEFDLWEYKERFIVAPNSTVKTFDADGKTNAFDYNAASLPSDAVITVNGVKVENGSSPGQYTFASENITFVTDQETFAADGETNIFTILNTDNIATNGYTVTVSGNSYPVDTSIEGDVPVGKARLIGNNLTFGINKSLLNGNGVTTTFTLVGKTGLTDVVLKLDGVQKTIVAIAPASASEVQKAESNGNTTFTFHATSTPGIGNGNIEVTWGFLANLAPVVITYGFPSAGKQIIKVFSNQTEVHAVVVDYDGKISGVAGDILERYEYLSTTPGDIFFDGTAKYYVDAINRKSAWVRVSASLITYGDFVLSGGVDDNKFGAVDGVTPGILQQGYNLFKNGEQLELYHIIVTDSTPSTALHVIQNIAEYRRDCVAYISPRFSDVVNNKNNEADSVNEYRSLLGSSSYYFIDSNWMKRYDLYNDKYRWVPCNGASAGAFALTHDLYDPWFSGAGLNRGKIKNAVQLAWNPSKTDRDKLYKNNVNPITSFLSEGPVLYGDKTGESKPSAFDHMNVRFLFIVLEKAIAKAAKYYLFEQNDEFTRNRFKNMVIPFLRTVKGRRGIEAYEIICSEKNNTADVVSRNEFIADIYVRPTYSINYITLNFNAVNGNTTFDEIING